MTTGVDYLGTSAPVTADQGTCAFYPLVDAYFFAPIGWRGATPSLASLGTNTVEKGDCPSTTSSLSLWQHYHLGTATAVA